MAFIWPKELTIRISQIKVCFKKNKKKKNLYASGHLNSQGALVSMA